MVRKTGDVSPYGIQDMAGNVSEWTASEHTGEPWPAHPDFPDLRVPVVRGGHFAQKGGNDLLTARLFTESASETTLARGFRVASDQPPPPPSRRVCHNSALWQSALAARAEGRLQTADFSTSTARWMSSRVL